MPLQRTVDIVMQYPPGFMKNLLTLVLTAALTAGAFAAPAPTMHSLFNGKDLTGWTGEGYVVEDETIIGAPEGKNLMTVETFSNYILEFDFKLPPGGNSGLGIHYPGTGDGSYTGMEIKILDNSDPKYKDLKDDQCNGSLYALAPAKRGGLKPVGEWNHEKVSVSGAALTVELNGEMILRANLDDLSLHNPKHAGVKRRAGQIAFLGHGDRVSFRNIQIAETPPLANTEGVMAAGFTRLFSGKNLNGWKSKNLAEWTVVNGILKHAGHPGESADLWTEKEYGDYTVVFDWRWCGSGPNQQASIEGGIYLRGENPVRQVDFRNDGSGSGGVHDNGENSGFTPESRALMTPKVIADRPAGEWNRTMVTVRGDRLTVSLNGRLVLNNVQLPGLPANGAIGIFDHDTAIDFANFWIKTL